MNVKLQITHFPWCDESAQDQNDLAMDLKWRNFCNGWRRSRHEIIEKNEGRDNIQAECGEAGRHVKLRSRQQDEGREDIQTGSDDMSHHSWDYKRRVGTMYNLEVEKEGNKSDCVCNASAKLESSDIDRSTIHSSTIFGLHGRAG